MRSLLRTLEHATIRDIALVCLADALVGASFGAIGVSGGLPLWVPIALSVLVFAGGSQFAAVGVVLSGGGALAAVATGLVLNARLLPFGFAVADVLGGPWWRRLLGAHLLTDETAAFTLQQNEPARRRAAYWLCGIALFLIWNLSVLLGAVAGGLIGDTDALGLDAAFPTVLLALVLPSLADRGTRTAAVAGAVVAVAATPFVPVGVPVLLALVGLLFVGRPAAGEAAGKKAREAAGERKTADERSLECQEKEAVR
ncbi:AzlC family ABC transporter permease [Streptomyces sp. CBMA156]|uniref:AzlC family ABC transporter permease n=1 Tax=Streptomyces sp. CBMA156 TaxID=1930280 RepID=UPI001661B49B|nr:AzlC family ABC transporter permease [Streptomyces sp. CBMA156]MBD0675591.1 branched-chain amino acid transporter AzlC [Streptomyces sp. CBMA156]